MNGRTKSMINRLFRPELSKKGKADVKSARFIKLVKTAKKIWKGMNCIERTKARGDKFTLMVGV